MRNPELEIKGSDAVCGVIGDPIMHTRSPQIQNALNRMMGQRAIYVPFFVKKEHLREAILGAHALHIKGLNATMPHKQELFKYVTAVDQKAEEIGAINTLVYTESGYKGYNTDYWGLQMTLKEKGVDWKGKKVAILGSGGAAYAAYAAIAKEAAMIAIFNRTKEKAEQLCSHMKKYYSVPCFVYSEDECSAEKFDIILQTTGVGMGDQKGQMPKAAPRLLEHAKVAMDLIYEPCETAFLKAAREKGCICLNGYGMLFYQAVYAFELMHKVKCPTAELLTLKEALYSEVEAAWRKEDTH